MGRVMRGQPVIAGHARGTLLVTQTPLSFWGGYDYHTGEIIDRRHPLAGMCAAGRVLAVPFTRGSSTTTAVLLEAIRAGLPEQPAPRWSRLIPALPAALPLPGTQKPA